MVSGFLLLGAAVVRLGLAPLASALRNVLRGTTLVH
jgi:hypothetical protein